MMRRRSSIGPLGCIICVCAVAGSSLSQAPMRNESAMAFDDGRVNHHSQPSAAGKDRANADVVRDYYRARDHDDFARAQLLEGDDLLLVNEHGEETKADSEKLRGFMDYEKYMHARWHCRILGSREGAIEAEVIEENDYYRYIGSGRRVLRERFTVSNGKIRRMQTVTQHYDGEDQDTTYRRFVDWLKEVHPDKLHSALPGGHLVFDGNGAREQLPLLKEFARTKHF